MSDRLRLSMRQGYRAAIVDLFPGVTAAQLMRLDGLIARGRFVLPSGEPHDCLIAWVGAVLDPRDDAPGLPVEPAPRPKPLPSVMEATL